MTGIGIRRFDLRECGKAASFAAVGMHLYRYISGKRALRLYSTCFLYHELLRSACSYAAYVDGEFKGLLLASMKGVGTALMKAFENDHPGRTVYVFTDEDCTYRFYEHRGFRLAGERTVMESDGKTEFPLRCLLHVKTVGRRSPRPAPRWPPSRRPRD